MMYRPPEEIAALKESFRKMDTAHKLEYIYIYYKWFILLGIIVLVILGNTIHRQLTKKEPVVFLGLVNVSVGSELEEELTAGYLDYAGIDPRKNEVLVYSGLYLSNDPASEDHQYAYASRMKIMASVNARRLDVVLMNRESYDLLSSGGYLLPLTGLSDAIDSCLVENEVVLESNNLEVLLNEEDEVRIVTQTAVNGMDVSRLPMFREAGFDGTVYAGIIVNTDHIDAAVSYLEYLTTAS